MIPAWDGVWQMENDLHCGAGMAKRRIAPKKGKVIKMRKMIKIMCFCESQLAGSRKGLELLAINP